MGPMTGGHLWVWEDIRNSAFQEPQMQVKHKHTPADGSMHELLSRLRISHMLTEMGVTLGEREV